MKYCEEFVARVAADERNRALSEEVSLGNTADGLIRAAKLLQVNEVTDLNKIIARWRGETKGRVFFRGQNRLHELYPYSSAYRATCSEISPMPTIFSNFLEALGGKTEISWEDADRLLESDRPVPDLGEANEDVPFYALEGLFQQYCGGTRWLDVVDNLGIALWMATKTYQRGTGTDGAPFWTVKNVEEASENSHFVILYLISIRGTEQQHRGLYATEEGSHLLDLREALPSRFLRPHAQHAALLKHDPEVDDGNLEYVGVRVPLDLALRCSAGELLDVPALFPESSDDYGFAGFLYLLRGKFLNKELARPVTVEHLPAEYKCDPAQSYATYRHRNS